MSHIIGLAVFGFFEVVLPVALATVVALAPVAASAADGWVLWEQTNTVMPKSIKERPGIVSLHDTKQACVEASKAHATKRSELLASLRPASTATVGELKNGQGYMVIFREDERFVIEFIHATCWPVGVNPQ